jgi:hypothetical protein
LDINSKVKGNTPIKIVTQNKIPTKANDFIMIMSKIVKYNGNISIFTRILAKVVQQASP